MEAGQQNNPKVGFIIQARMRSARLPGKVLLPIPLNGEKPIIQWIADAVSRSKYFGEIILATSVNKENDPLESYCKAHNIQCYRGDEDNVLSRFIDIVKHNDFDVIVRLTGDNPLIDCHILDEVIAWHLNQANDYTKSEGLPIGMNFEVVNSTALLALEKMILSSDDEEHVTLRIRNEAMFKQGIYAVTSALEHLRLTVDYPGDFLVVATILSLLNSTKVYEAVQQIYQQKPWIFEGNANNIQKRFFQDPKDEVAEATMVLEKLDMRYAANILNSFRS